MSEELDVIVDKIKVEKDVFIKAKLIRQLLQDDKIKGAELAQKLGINPSYVCHFDRLNSLPEIVVDGYYSKLVTVSHLFLISRIKDIKKVTEIYTKVLSENLTIRDTEELVRDAIYGVATKGNYITENEKRRLQESMIKKYPETKMRIVQTKIRGKVILETKGSLQSTSKIIKEMIGKLSD